MATVRTFDTLGYAKFLAENGFEKNQAEALAEANYEFLINDLATKEFVRTEIMALENRQNRANAKLVVFATGVILAGIPIIQALITKLG